LYAVAALILRCVAGHVGRAHHIGHGGGLVGDLYDPNADADGQYTVLPDESIIADGLPQRFRQTQGLIERATLEQDAEFVAPQARQGVAAAHSRLQYTGNLLQQLIARRMTTGIVDQFELIQIKVQQSVPAVGVLANAIDRRSESIFEFAPIDEAGQRVMAGLVVQRAVQAPFFADVVEHHDGTNEISRAVADRRSRVLDRDFLPAAIHQDGVFGETHYLAFPQATHDRTFARCTRDFIDQGQYVADELILSLPAFPSGQALGNRIHVIDAPFGIGGDDGITDRLERDLRALLGLEYRGFRLLTFGNIGDRAFEYADASLFVEHHPSVVDDHQHRTVFAAQDVLEVADFAFALHAPHETVAIGRIPIQRAGRHLIDFLGRGVAQHLDERGIHHQEAAAARRSIHPFHDAFEQPTKLRFAFAQSVFGAAPFDRDTGDLRHTRHQLVIAGRRHAR